MAEPTNLDIFVDAVRSAAGHEAVDRLYRERGGCEYALPKFAYIGNWLVEAIGLEGAQKVVDLMKCFDADGRVVVPRIYIPLGRHAAREQKQQEALALLSQGMTVRDVARKVGLSVRTTSRIHSGKFGKQRAYTPRNKLRIGLLEMFILEGRSDALIRGRLGVTAADIARRREILKRAGMLNASTLQRAQQLLVKVGERIAEPLLDPPADAEPFLPPGEVI